MTGVVVLGSASIAGLLLFLRPVREWLEAAVLRRLMHRATTALHRGDQATFDRLSPELGRLLERSAARSTDREVRWLKRRSRSARP